MNRIHCAAIATAWALASTAIASATTTRSFRQTTAKELEEGEASSTMVVAPGEVLPGFKTTRVPIDAAFAWCAAASSDHATAYFGTGDDGNIVAIPVAGGAAKKVAHVDSPWVTALSVRKDGNLLAGSTPGGRVFLVDPKTGKSSSFAKLAAEHVWAMASDEKRGLTYVATGDPGKIFVVDGSGGARLLWDSGDKHVMSLALDGSNVLAGTADKAILYRVRSDGRAEVLHDFEANEVRAVVRAKGATFIAVNDFENPADAKDGPPLGAQPAKGTRIVAGPAPASGAIARSDAIKAKAAIYRLDDDGRIEQLFALPDGYFTSLLQGRNGDVFAASGSQGKVYRIAADRTVALAVDVPERQALSLLQTSDGFLVGTGDVGAIYRARPAQKTEAVYLSKVLDAEAPALWGRIWWTGSPDLLFETRSGNTGKPDGSWSEFHGIDAVTRHPGESSGRVASPGGRYLQYRATFPAASSMLRDISIYYLPHNQRARVTEVYLADAPGASSTGVGRAHSSTLKLRWKVENPDNDELIYRIWFRQEGDSVWRSLGGPDPLTKPEYDWNTDSVPDGRYAIRVWTSDEKVTPIDRALDQVSESPPFLVDNTRPEVVDLAAVAGGIKGRARDAASVITTIEYTVDSGDWRPVEPEGKLLDSREKPFAISLPKSAPTGPHIINVRAWDSADNVGTARIEIGRRK